MSLPLPAPTPDTQFYWDEAANHRLVLQFCNTCNKHYFYPRSHCRYCGSGDVSWRRASGRARLVSYVINRRRTADFEAFSPVIALVELEEEVRMMSNIVGVAPDPANLALDMPLSVAFEERQGRVLPVFQPVGMAQ